MKVGSGGGGEVLGFLMGSEVLFSIVKLIILASNTVQIFYIFFFLYNFCVLLHFICICMTFQAYFQLL